MLGYLFAVISRAEMLFLAVPALWYKLSISRFHIIAPKSCLLIGPDSRDGCLAYFIVRFGSPILVGHACRRDLVFSDFSNKQTFHYVLPFSCRITQHRCPDIQDVHVGQQLQKVYAPTWYTNCVGHELGGAETFKDDWMAQTREGY